MSALAHIARTHEDVELVYPVHLSPVVQECAKKHLADIPNVHLTAPLAADEMHNLMARCYLVLTDSGGLQEEWGRSRGPRSGSPASGSSPPGRGSICRRSAGPPPRGPL